MNARNIIGFLSIGLTTLLASFAKTELVEELHDQAMLDVVKKNPTGTVVFFNHSSEKPGLELVSFAKEFKKAAKALQDYGVKFYNVDCTRKSINIKDECSQSRNYVTAYSLERNEEMDLPILFDEDHIVGHILMFLLQKDVFLAQDKYMWDEVLTENKGSKDIVLALTKGLGDSDHRYFMETAFVYGKEYKFVITTEKSMPGVQGDGTLWYYQCKGVQEGEECTFNVRQKPPNSVLDVLRFIKLGELPRIVEIMQNGSSIFDKQDVTFPLNKVYLFSKDINKARSLASEAIKEVDDSFFFILVNVETRSDLLAEFGLTDVILDEARTDLVLQPAHLIGSDEKYYEQWPLGLDFNLKNLVNLLNTYHKNPNKAYTDIVSSVNVVYETIQEWKKPKEGIMVVGGCMKELPACVSFQILFRRISRSIIYSELEDAIDVTYVDFSDSSDDAKLNTLPAFMIYKNGKEYSHNGEMDFDSLLKFVWRNLSPQVFGLPLSGSDHMPLQPVESIDEDREDLLEQAKLLELEDDSVGRLAVDIVQQKVQDEEVPALTDKTFNSTKEANELMMTLFYLPWCVKSIVLREAYAQLVKKMEESKLPRDISTSINKVNCFDWEDICRKEKVVAYPTIKVYRKGLLPNVYSSSLDVETMFSTVKRYQAPVLTELKDSKSLEAYLDVSMPSLSPVSVVGLFEVTDSKNLQAFRIAAEELFGRYTFAFATGSVAKESAKDHQFPVPSFVLLKRNDPVEQMTGSKDFSAIGEFIEEHSLPFYGELTVINFPKYRMYGKPLVINFKDSNDTLNDSVMQLLAIQESSVFVTWMDKNKKVTQEIMQAYSKSLVSGIVFVSHKQGKVYKYDGVIEEERLSKWVNQCIEEKMKPIAMLSNKKWEPLRRDIDYLQKIEASEAKKNGDEVQQEADGKIDDEGNDDDSSFDDTVVDDESNDGLKNENTRDEL